MAAARIAALLIAGLALLAPGQAAAADRGVDGCLAKEERRVARASGRALRLSEVRTKLNIRRSDIINVRLCESPAGLVYLLTLLPRNGKVSRVTVEAATGAVVHGR
ncbi:MAG: hypothetical protein AB7O50_09330 [Pseudolabrys sp.]